MFAGFIAFLAVTGTLLVLPVYAAPVPKAEPVKASIDEVPLGSVTDPAEDAVVVTDGKVQPDAASGAGATPSAGPQEDQVVSSGEELDGVPALTVSQPQTDTFSTVGVTWRDSPAVTDVVVQLRVKDASNRWGEWTSLQADDVEQTESEHTGDAEVRAGTAPYWTGKAHGIEVIVQGAGGREPQDVKVALLDPGTSKADSLPAVSAVQDGAHAAAAMPAIVTRAQWGADESIRTWDPEYAATIKAATLHHTADGNNYTADQVPGIMRSIYAYHTLTRGWGDIGYNVIVDKFGRIFEGRYGGLTSTVIGAHAGGFNTGTFGVSMLGNYEEVDTPAPMLESVAAVMAWKLSLYGVNPQGTTQLTSGGGGTSRYEAGTVVTVPTVFAHRDVGFTACPGQYAYSRMDQIRAMVLARMGLPGGSPTGNLEIMSLSGAELSLRGWTFDPDYPSGSLSVGVVVDGVTKATIVADAVRPDVGAAYPQAGSRHGLDKKLTLPGGNHTVCVVFLNAPPSGVDAMQRCQFMRVPVDTAASKNPIGNFEAVTANGRTLSGVGWTFDPDAATTALDVHIYVNGQWGGSLLADRNRSDVAASYPSAGSAHGFTWSTTVTAPGTYEVCAYAINKNVGTTNPELGCRKASVSAALWDPFGSLDSVTVAGRDVTLSGWAVDMDNPASPLSLHVYVDGRWGRSITADTLRADVGRAVPGAGDQHGFKGTLEVPGGQHQVCAYLINTGQGSTNPLLACRTVTVAPAAWNPFGSLDSVSASGNVVTASGWVIEPDQAQLPADVHVYVDGVWRAARGASVERNDVGRAYPQAGSAHGFSVPVTVVPGRHEVCVYAINVGGGTTNPLIACRTVTS
jgi:hypothetical protein